MNKFFLFFLLLFINTSIFAWSDTLNNKDTTNSLQKSEQQNAFNKAKNAKKENQKSQTRFLPFYTAPFIILIIALAAKKRRQRKKENKN
jgi:hypothetical protein